MNPPRYKGIPVIREDRCENMDRDCVHPPVSLVYLAGVLREEGHVVELVDLNKYDLSYEILRNHLKTSRPDWVIYRTTPSTFYHDSKVAYYANKCMSKSLLLCWNLHNISEVVLEKAPFLDVYINSYHYENAIPEAIEKYPDIDEVNGGKVTDIPNPPWDLVGSFKPYYTRTKLFSPWAVVRGSKGCPYECNFCIDSGTGWYPRSPELIGEELEYLVNVKRVPYISFFDNAFEVNADWCMEIASEIKRRDLRFKWYINSRADLICKHGLSFFQTLKSVGLDGSSLGIEFGSQEMLNDSGKGTTVEQNEKAINILHEAGIKSYVSAMIGYFGETKKQMRQTFDMILKTKPTGFQVNIVVPYPGTTLWDVCEKAGVLPDTLDWRGLSCVPTDVLPVKMTEYEPSDLSDFRRKMYRRVYLSRWFVTNALRLRTLNEFKLGIGYFVSSVNRLLRKVEFSH